LEGLSTTATSPTAVAGAPRPMALAREIELKLRAPAGVLEAIRRAPLIVEHAVNQGVVRKLDATYYDTPDRLLDRRGLSLRVRRHGTRYIQTVKRISGEDGPLARCEWETPVPGEALDLSRLLLAEIGAPLDSLDGATLRPVFSSMIRRRVQRMEFNGALIEIAFDDGLIKAGAASEALSEIELELKRGDAAVLYELGLLLLDLAPLQLETASKAARGYRLAFDAAPRAAKAERVGIVPDDNTDAAIAKLLASGHHHLIANLAPVEQAGDMDGVHQMRVSLRRLRTAFSLIRSEIAPGALEPIATEAKQLARVLGRARNWDVLVTQTLPGIGEVALPDLDVAALARAAEPIRADCYAAVRDKLASAATNRFLLSFGCLLERRGWRNGVASDAMTVLAEPATALAERALAKAHRTSLKRGRHFGRLDSGDRHRLRLSLKKLRYTAEFFRTLYPGNTAAEKYLKRLETLQDALGAANDAVTTQPLLADLKRGGTTPELHYAAGAVTGWLQREQIARSRGLNRRWRKFRAAKPFWE
jgi:inorganic triphosphatase YgiF